MIRPIDLPVVVAQAPLAQHIQFAAQSAPGAHQAFLSLLVVQKHQREMQQVAKTEKTQPGSSSVKEREAHGKESRKGPFQQKNHEEQHYDIPEDGDHIVDIKV